MTHTIRQLGVNGHIYLGGVCVDQYGIRVVGACEGTAMRFDSYDAACRVREVAWMSDRGTEGWMGGLL